KTARNVRVRGIEKLRALRYGKIVTEYLRIQTEHVCLARVVESFKGNKGFQRVGIGPCREQAAPNAPTRPARFAAGGWNIGPECQLKSGIRIDYVAQPRAPHMNSSDPTIAVAQEIIGHILGAGGGGRQNIHSVLGRIWR